jgi:hypothetical protein
VKKWIPCFAVAMFLLIVSVAGAEEKETDKETAVKRPGISLGASFQYTWWRPAWESIKIDKRFVLGNVHPKINPTVVFGINAAFKFNYLWSLSAAFTYGEFGVTVQKYFPIMVPIKPKFESKAQRFEADLTASYSLHSYVKVFAGAKYQGQITSMRYLKRYTFRPNHAGLVAGFSFVLPITSTFIFMPAVSGLILGGKESRGSSAMAGCEASGSFVFHIPLSGLAVSLGGRYEYLAYISGSDPYYNNDAEQLYGVTLALIFSF